MARLRRPGTRESLLLLAVLTVAARDWNPTLLGALVICLAQIALLGSPPVKARVRRDRDPATAAGVTGGWAAMLAGIRRPPNWLLAGGVFTGIFVALACGASMNWTPIPGSKPAFPPPA